MDPAFERHCSELVAQERSGHTAVVEDNLLYVWGGYMSVPDDDVFLPNDEIWVYDTERGVWEVKHMTGEVPPPMSDTCGCSLNGHMYIFGGNDNSGLTNQFYCVNLSDGKYTSTKIIHESGSAPSPRAELSCWVWSGRVIYFGGYGYKKVEDVGSRNENFIKDSSSGSVDFGWNNEVHIFDPTHASWSEPKTHVSEPLYTEYSAEIQGRAPSPRAAHASATLGCRGYVCGGRVMETRMSDIHCLNLESWTWSEIIPVCTTPVGRSWHTLTAVSDSSLFLFGGLSIDCKPMSDGWLFDVEMKEWREVEHPFKDKPRLCHTACVSRDSDVIVFGGSSEYMFGILTEHCNDTLVFQMQPYPLFRICGDYIAKNLKNYEVLRNRLPLLPPKLLTAVQRKMSLDRPSTKQH